jgi:hypothetical protein
MQNSTATLTQFGPNIWIADGATVSVAGFRYPTRMAVMRLADGGLFVWSPVALSLELRAAVDVLGPVRFIVAPNALHDLYLAAWHSAYPTAQLFAAPRLAARRPDFRFAGELGEAPEMAWAGDIDQVLMRNAITTEAVFFHRASRTVLFTDLIQHFPRGWFKGWRAIVARLDRMTGPEPAVPQKFRLGFTDRKAVRLALQRVRAWPAEKVLMAHGAPVTENGATFIARAFEWLGP